MKISKILFFVRIVYKYGIIRVCGYMRACMFAWSNRGLERVVLIKVLGLLKLQFSFLPQ